MSNTRTPCPRCGSQDILYTSASKGPYRVNVSTCLTCLKASVAASYAQSLSKLMKTNKEKRKS